MNRREALKHVGWIMGGTLAASTIAGVLGGCKSGNKKWVPQAVSPEENELITSLTECIIPQTDTPGAKAAKVNEFIDLMLADWLPVEEADHFRKGLADVDTRAQNQFQSHFAGCTTEQQNSILNELQDEAIAGLKLIDPQDKKALRPFFAHLKELTLIGYYTSEIGASQELRYMAAAGVYNGCVPFSEIGRAWAM